MNIAVIGCGYVAEFYGKTLINYPELKLIGAYDINPENLTSFCRRWAIRPYTTLQQLLDDPSVEMVLNLTNPRSHYPLTKLCIEAGKHVYSEKPLAMDANSARCLVELAKKRNVYLAAAPCSILSETAQTLWKALREKVVGRVRLVFANFDDGMIAPRLSPWQWRNEAGVAWPAKDEFEVGCTYEHAGYVLTWLAAFFGPAMSVTAFASCQIPDKGFPVDSMAPDLTVGCIEYSDGVVARVTCSLIAPRNKSVTIIGDEGILTVPDVRNDAGPVYFEPASKPARVEGLERCLNHWTKSFRDSWGIGEWHYRRVLRPTGPRPRRFVSDSKPVDFCRGPAEFALAILENRPCRLSPELAIHTVELIEGLQYPERFGGKRLIMSTFVPIEPVSL